MVLTVDLIITILAVVGSAFTVYFSFKKVGDNMQKRTKEDIEWKTTVNGNLKEMMEDIKEIKDTHKENQKTMKEVVETQIRQSGEIETIKKDMAAVWRNIDELKGK